MLKYEQHYSAGQVAQYEPRWGKLHGELYVQRDKAREGGALKMVRVGAGVRYYSITLGAHLRRVNYGRHWYSAKGCEVWCSVWRLNVGAGILTGKPGWRERMFAMRFSGSMREPYHAVTLRAWRAFVTLYVPARMQRWLEKRAAAKWEKEFAAYEAAHPEMFVGEPQPDEYPNEYR